LTHQIRTADPSWPDGAVSPDGTPSLIALRRSLVIRVLAAALILIATAAVYSCLAPRLGGWHALPLALAVLALLASSATAHASAQPRALKIGPDGLSVWGRGRDALAHGPIVGCSRWGGWLLILAVANDGGRLRRLIIAADALPDDAFRKLAVLGRHGSAVL
jgi:hypothetical protein